MGMNHEGVNLVAFASGRFWLVDVFPLRTHSLPLIMLWASLQCSVQYAPSWFPGTTFQQVAKRSREVTDYIRFRPWELVLDRVCTCICDLG